MTKLTAKEEQLQVFTKQLLDTHGVAGLVYFHVPNEGRRSVTTGRRLLKQGMRPGVSDVILAVPPEGRMGAIRRPSFIAGNAA